jgi:glutathione S-transferase
MEHPKIKLSYLDKRVRGECIRLALVVGGIPFEDERLDYDEIARKRASGELPMSQVPVMEIGDGHGPYPQSQALLRWAGRKGGLYPEEWQLTIDCVTETVSELQTETIKIGYGSIMLRNPTDGQPMVRVTPGQREEMKRMLSTILMPTRFQQLERIIEKHGGPYFCSEQLTIADLSFYAFASAISAGAWEGNGVPPSVLHRCPKLMALERAIAEHPKVKAWNDANPRSWFG